MSKQWLLVVHDGKAHDRALHKLGLRPSTRDARQYVGFYAPNAKPQLLRHIDQLKAMRLHGRARLIKKRQPTKPKPRARRPNKPTRPSAEIIRIQDAKRARLQADADKRRREIHRQGQILAEREAADRAHHAVRRLKGEV